MSPPLLFLRTTWNHGISGKGLLRAIVIYPSLYFWDITLIHLIEITVVASFPNSRASADLALLIVTTLVYHKWETKPLWEIWWFYLDIPCSYFCSTVPAPFQMQSNTGILPDPWELSRDERSTFLFSDSLDLSEDVLATSIPKLRRGNRIVVFPQAPTQDQVSFPTLIHLSIPQVKWPFYRVPEIGKWNMTNCIFSCLFI